MKTRVILMARPCIIAVQGCALPVPGRAVSWTVDGIVLVTTDKSVSDHGISMITQKDCSFLRGFTKQQFCIDRKYDAKGSDKR